MICPALISSSSHICTDSVFFFVDYPTVSCAQLYALHRIQWDEAQVIHKEENTITTELKELVLITRADGQVNALAP
jgi:hypothetical protein